MVTFNALPTELRQKILLDALCVPSQFAWDDVLAIRNVNKTFRADLRSQVLKKARQYHQDYLDELLRLRERVGQWLIQKGKEGIRRRRDDSYPEMDAFVLVSDHIAITRGVIVTLDAVRLSMILD